MKKRAPGCLEIHPRKLTWIPKTNCYYMAFLVSILNFSGVLRDYRVYHRVVIRVLYTKTMIKGLYTTGDIGSIGNMTTI